LTTVRRGAKGYSVTIVNDPGSDYITRNKQRYAKYVRNPGGSAIMDSHVVPDHIKEHLSGGDENALLEAMAGLLTSCYEALHYIDPKSHKRKRRTSPATDNAKRARAGLAAKRLGISFEDYLQKYGLVDSPSKAKKKRKRKK